MRCTSRHVVLGVIGLLVGGSASAVPVLTTLANFNGVNGSGPSFSAGLITDAAGNFYGTTAGGFNNFGTVFKVPAGGGPVTTLATFNGANGSEPYAGLVSDGAGHLYGTTYMGGANGQGTVYTVPSGGGPATTLVTFNGPNGANPLAGLIIDSAGNLYGTTQGGGANGAGIVFTVPAAGGPPVTLATFNGVNGAEPEAALLADSSGNLYGTTYAGGTGNFGTVFRVPAGGGAVTTLATFNNTNGSKPRAGLIADAMGNLYGTTSTGGPGGNGTVFEVPAGSGSVKTLATFAGSNGFSPYAALLADAAGNLYGTTYFGGASGVGTLFEVPAGGGPVDTLVTFTGSNGSNPLCALIADSAGNLYGTTYTGGTNNGGTVFGVAGTGFVVPEPAGLSLLLLLSAPGMLARRRLGVSRR